ncbi:minor tail protein [Arthrobacter phage Atuin]|nr:minor tail protein [Arthrobacter phage Atuin]
MQYDRLRSETALADALKKLDSRISKVETKGTGTIGFVGTDGVELRIGPNPDGTVGVTPFIGDTTPPPVATAPIASAGPGFITVVWDGLFVNGEAQPADFTHLNVIGYKIVSGARTGSGVSVGMIRATLDSCLVGTDIAAPGDTWEFVFTSQDYNANISVESAASERVVQKSFAADALITDALDGLAQDFITAQNAAASAQQAADAAQSDANQIALDLTKKGTVYTQSVQPAADMNGLWIDKGHNNVPRRYLGVRKALFVNVGGGASVGARLISLGWDVTTVTAIPTLADASNYDLVAFDAGYAGLGNSSRDLAVQLWDRGVSIFTSGNDTTNMAPLFTGGINRGTPKNNIRATGNTAAGTGWADYSDADLNYYLTGINASAIVTGVALVGAVDQPINVVMEHATTFARWTHVQTYATPVSVLNAHLNWISDNWVAIQDQAVVSSIAAAQLKADQAFNNAATAASAAGTAQTTADSKNRSWYQDDQPAGTSHKVGDTWYDTNDGYKLRTWTGSIWQTTQDSALAQLTADSKGRTYTQDTVPPVDARLPQNLWIDTSAGPGLYVTKYWNGTTWAALKDKDADAAQQTADSKGETIYSDTEPAVAKRLPQNTWVDTTGGVNITKRWYNNAWTPTVDSRIPSTAAAVTAVSSKVDSVSALAEAKGTYTQSVAPPLAARLPQTIWNDTSLGLDKVVTKYWDGNAWTAVSDKAATDAQQAASGAQSTADAKGETIYSDTAPPASKQLPQNTWVDTTGGINITKRWVQGSGWVITVDSRIPSTAAAVTAVDSRVTGVSAAANTAVATVDSKVTSVSAAASASVAVVDARVTAASAVAVSKGETIYSSTIPTADKQLPQNQWVDTTGGINIVKRWNTATGTWVVASDQRIDTTAAAVTAVDSRVTGVSAAASTAVGTVDARVTGVSAAANTQIGNVDSRVTGVSAAAASEIGTVDSRVTAVSGIAVTKTKTYLQGTTPGLVGNTMGDMWFDTANGNKAYIWNGAWTVAQDTSINKALFGTFSTDIDNQSPNKWMFTKYDKALGASVIPSYLDIIGLAGTSSLVADGTNLVTNVAENYIGQLRTIVNVVSSKTIAITATHDDAAQIYVDGVSVYSKNAYTQNAAISFFVSAGWHVIDVLWAEQAGGDGFNGISPTIGSQVTSMFAPVSLSSTTKAVADAQAAATNAMNAQSYSNNASFDDWTSTYPVGYANWSGTPVKETSIIKRAPYSMRFNVPDATAQQGVSWSSILSHAPNLEFFTVEVDLYLVSGTLDGSGMILDWTGMTNNRAQINFASEIPGVVTGKWYRVSKVLRRPTNAAGTWTAMTGYLMGQWTGHGAGAAKNIIFDWFNVRPSTFEEILSYKAPTTADLTAVDTRVTGVSATAGSQLSTLDTRVTGVSAAASTGINTVDTRVTGVSATAGSLLSSLDTKVTSVSAAASGQINSVDTRVTGVSAAASTQIGTVDSRVTGVSSTAGSLLSSLDTKVTGVSAAANTQIGTVDTRVTGVSAAASGQITTVDTRVTGVSAAANTQISDATAKANAAQAAAERAATQTVNKLVNPGFEAGLANWTPGRAVLDTTTSRSGVNSVRVDGGTGTRMTPIPVSTPVVSGQKWRIGVWYKTTADYNGTAGNGKLRWGDQTDAHIQSATFLANQTNWTWIEIERTVGTETAISPTLNSDHTVGKIWFDEVEVRDVTELRALEAAATQAKADAIAAAALDATNKVTVVDTRVTGVSAAASGQITNVDTRVTGVSAAANTQIGTVDTRVTGVSAAASGQITTVDTRVTGVSAAANTQIGTVDTRVTSVSAAASGQITTVDARVTGVSAAAGTAITNVDTRVTGVSSAAGTAITNVDTKVTGVSAAANTQIGTVDSRVTGVSAAAGSAITTVDSRVTGVSSAASSGIATVDSRVSSVSASVTSVDSRVTGVSAAAGSAISTVDARVTGVSSAAGTAIGTVDARVTGVSSAAGSAISTVDGRVTGVSAAAGTAIGNVDARVTGVSSAASGQINTVDTRVSGVSAAAGSAISTVDGRVTGVSAAAGSAIGTVDARVTGVSAAANSGISSVQSGIDRIWASSRSYHNDGTSVSDIQVMNGLAPTIVSSTTGMGGKAIQKSGTGNGWWHDNRAKQAYDPTALYRLTIRVRVVTNASNGGGKGFYWGFAGLAADGTTFVNVSGANSYSSQQWAYQNIQVPTDGNWVDYVAYYRGLSATTPSGAGTSLSAPRLMHADTRYVVPSMIIDYSAGNGVWEVSHWSIDVIDSAGYAQLVDASTKSVTYYDPNMPTGGTYKKGDLWIDTDDGNKIYAHNGTTFVSAQDTAITSAATSASAAMTAANGKNKVIWSPSAASGTAGYSAGDVWFQTSSGIIIGQWEFTTAWQSRTIDNAVIANLNAGKITAGTLDANRIGANSITANKIFVGDFTNLAADGNFVDTNKLSWTGSGSVMVSAGQPNRLKVTTAASGNNDQANVNVFQVEGGEQVYVDALVYGETTNVGGGGPNVHLTVTMHDGTTQWPGVGLGRSTVQGVWYPLKGTITVPANAKTAKVELAVNYSADAVGNVYYFREVTVRRKATGELIVDGAIKAGSAIIENGAIGNAQIADLNAAKINAGTIAAARLDANDIRAKVIEAPHINAVDLIASGSISSSTGVFGVLDASSINAGTIGAARLNADDIRTKLLSAAKINAIDLIASGSISSSTGLFGDINASAITSGTLSAARIGAGSITASALSVTMGGNNLVANSSFEVDSNGDGLADGWQVWARGAGDAGRVFTNTLVAGMFPGSTYAQRVTSTTVTNTEQSSIQATTLFAINAGDKVTLSLYIRASVAGSFSVSMRCEDNAGVYKGDANFLAPVDTTTQRFFSVVTIPAGTTRAKVTITTPLSLSNGHWFEVDGIKAELGDMVSAWSPMTAELLPGTINASMLTATAIDGKTITGATIQTELAGSRGIKLTTTELAGWDTTGQKNFSLTSTGTLAIRGAIQSGSSITGTDIVGGTVTGSIIQTDSTPVSAARGIKLTSTELAGYDAAGTKNFSLTSGGTLALRGALQSGSTIQGAAVSASGIYTNASPTAGVKLSDTGIKAYNGSGALTFHLDSATGLLEVPGLKASSITSAMISATAIDGKTITGATMTGGLIQTDNTAIDTSASRGIKLTTNGLFGYDGTGTKTFNLSSTGTLAIKGTILAGSTITGAGFTAGGAGLETNVATNRGVKIQDTGITSYDASGNVTFKVDAATGLVEAPGIKAGSISSAALAATAIDGKSITGATLTGGLIQTDNTAIDTAASRGIKLTTSGLFGYDNTGTKTFNLSNTGALTLKGNILSGSTITGAKLAASGGGIVTSDSNNTGVKITDQGIKAYDGTNLTFHLDATSGMLEVPGIKTNSLAGDKITTGSLTADKLLVSDFTNLLDDAIILGPGWTKGGNASSSSVVFDTNEKTNVWRFNAVSGQVDVTNKNVIPVNTIAAANGKPTDQFWLSVRTYSTLTVAGYLRVLFINDANTQVGYYDITVPASSGWTTRSADIGGTVAYPAGTKFLKIQPIIGSNATTGYILYGSMVLRRKNGGELLVDGSLDAKTITGSLIQTDNTAIDTAASRGIKLTTSGLFGYDGSGNKNFNLGADGSLTLKGAIKSGSTIEGATLTGTAGIETSPNATTGVKINNAGIKAYDGSNNLTFSVDSATGLVKAPGLEANSIKGDKIASDTISTRTLLVSDMTNPIENPLFETGNLDGWTVTGGWYVNNASPQEGTYKALTQYSGVEQTLINNAQIYLNALDKVKVKIYVLADAQTGGNRLTIGLTNVTGGASEDVQVPTFTNGSWTEVEVKLTATTSGYKRLRLSTTGTGTGYVRIDNVRMFRMGMGNMIVDGAITTDHMTSGTINGGVISAGSLTSVQIKAKSIQTDDLVITSTDNLITEADFGNNGSSWDLTPAYKFIMPDRGRGSLPALRIVGGTVEVKALNLNNKIPVDPTNRYRAAISVRSTEALAAGKVKMYLRTYTTAVSSTDVEVMSNSTPLVANTWTNVTKIIPALAPDVVAVEVILSAQNSDSLTWTEIDYVSLTRAMDASLVVDGSITAGKIDAGAVNATHIAAGAITASAISTSALWSDSSWLGVAGASQLTLKSTGTPVSAIYTYTDENGANPSTGVLWNTPETAVSPAGIHIYNIMRDNAGIERDRKPIVKLGHFVDVNGVDEDDDYFSIDKAGQPQITMNAAGDLTAQKLFVGNSGGNSTIMLNGDDIGAQLRAAPRGIVAWGQWSSSTGEIQAMPSLGSTGGDVGLFEIGWDTSMDSPERMYNVTLAPFLVNLSNVNTTTGSTVGLRMWITTNGTRPQVGVGTVSQYQYVATKTNGFQTLHMPTKLISSANGNYIRVLFSLYANCAADVYDSQNVTLLVNDLGEYPQESGVTNNSGGSNGGTQTTAPTTTPKVTKTVEWGYTSVRSFYNAPTTHGTSGGTFYNYNTSKGYQGLSPAGYGNLGSMYLFPDTINSALDGATINGVWIYLYFEHWYYAGGGTAKIRLHNKTTTQSTFSSLVNGMDSGSWPRGAGRWVAVPSSIWSQFDTTFKGVSLVGDGTYNTYGIANNCRIRIKYTK